MKTTVEQRALVRRIDDLKISAKEKNRAKSLGADTNQR